MAGLAKEMGKAVTGRLNNGLPQVPPAKVSSELSSFQQTLPIYQMKDVITKAINDNRVLMISGETGSGKTTQACGLIFCLVTLRLPYEGRSKSFATQYDAQMTQAKFLCYYST